LASRRRLRLTVVGDAFEVDARVGQQRAERAVRIVGRSVVDDQDLDRLIRLTQYRLHRRRQIARHVVARDYDRDERRFLRSVRGGGHGEHRGRYV